MAEEPTPTPEPTPAPAPEPVAATPEPSPEPTPDPSPAPEDWRASIEDADLRKQAERIESPAAAVKIVADLRKELSSRIKPLGDTPSDDDLVAYRKQMGIPETAEGYEFTAPEGVEFSETDKAFHGVMAEAMHKANVTPAQATVLAQAHSQFAAEFLESQNAESAAAAVKAKETLDKEYGADAARNYEYAKRAAKEFGGPEMAEFLENAKVDGMALGDHPMFVRTFAQIGRRSGESGIDLEMTAGEKATTKERIDSLGKEIDEALGKGDHSRANQLDREQRALYGRMDGAPAQNIGPGGVAVAQ